MLYALRYQKTQTANIATLINLLLSNGVPAEDARVRFTNLGFVTRADRVVFTVGLCCIEYRRLRSTAR
jgi:vacuolar protein sorting-associated protein 45